MPELPEVEVTRRGFAERLRGANVQGVRMGKPLRWPLGLPPDALVGQRVSEVTRRGKYILIGLGEGGLLLHLGMSGSLQFSQQLAEPGPHDHFDLLTDQGALRLHDPRRFGAVVWVPAFHHPRAVKLLGGLGVEPLGDDFEPRAFHLALRKRSGAIKQVLLGGQVVVGVGNIYASEALFLAGIRPTACAAKLSKPRVARLHAAIRDVLSRAIELGGSSLRDFSNTSGESGYFQLQAQVYGREGEPCRVCLTPIQMLRQGQRSTYFCKNCQKP
jgi:formamidopyrimidine-DNA glycosylase